MTVDIFTLTLLLSLANFLQVVALYLQYRTNRTYPGGGWWTAGTAAIGLGFILITLRGQPVFGQVFTFGYNLCFMLGAFFCYTGIMHFQARRIPRKLVFVLGAISVLTSAYFSLINYHPILSRVNLSITIAILLLLIAWQFFTHNMRGLNTTMHFLGSIFLFTGVFFSLITFSPLGRPFLQGAIDIADMQVAAYTVMFAATTLWTFGFIILVSQRLTIENREAREHFEEIFHTSPDAVLITRVADGCVVEMNEGLTAMTGFSRDELIGKTTLETKIFRNLSDRQRLLEALRNDGHCENMEFAFQRKDGSLLMGIVSAKVFDLMGSHHILSVTRDITERYQMEKALQASKDQINQLLQTTDQGIYGLDIQGKITFINQSALRMLGYTLGECTGQMAHPLIHHSHLDGTAYPSQECPIYNTLKTGISCQLDDEVLWCKDGSYLIVEYSAFPIYEEGQLRGAVVTFSDISERKRAEQALQESEQRYRLLAYHSNDVIWTIDLEGHFTYVSPSVMQLRGFTPEEVLQQTIEEAVCPGSIAAVQEGLAGAFQEIQSGIPSPTRYIEVEQPCKDGGTVWTEATARVMYDENHKAFGLVGASRDITERRRLQAVLQEHASKDALTGVTNRRHFLDLARIEIKRAQRHDLSLTLAMIDLDHLKRVNDTYGHAAGDLALQKLTSVFIANIREIDIFARYAGDEFVLLLPKTTAEQAFAIIERVRSALANFPIEYNGKEFTITISSGIAALDEEESIEMLLEKTDQALYLAKQAGRNGVVVCPSQAVNQK